LSLTQTLQKVRPSRNYISKTSSEISGLVLQSTGGNKLRAARILGMTRLTLRTKLRELGWSDTKSAEGYEDDPV
jgi:DNA-binding protein Fis